MILVFGLVGGEKMALAIEGRKVGKKERLEKRRLTTYKTAATEDNGRM